MAENIIPRGVSQHTVFKKYCQGGYIKGRRRARHEVIRNTCKTSVGNQSLERPKRRQEYITKNELQAIRCTGVAVFNWLRSAVESSSEEDTELSVSTTTEYILNQLIYHRLFSGDSSILFILFVVTFHQLRGLKSARHSRLEAERGEVLGNGICSHPNATTSLVLSVLNLVNISQSVSNSIS